MSQVNWNLVIGISAIALMIGLVILFIVWIGLWLLKKFKDNRKQENDLEYFKYKSDIKMCIINCDPKFAYRVWYKLWIGKKRSLIYAKTENGRKVVGYYLGEAVKKEGFMLLGIRQKYGLFSFEDDVVIFPYELNKQLIKRNDDFSIDLHCEGIDEVMSSEYYSIPVFKNYQEGNDKIFTDFSNLVMDKFFKEYAYRDVIKTNISEFREGIKEATEMNPSIQYGRKKGSDLNGE